ncbi:VOC family protein [Micromonospora sp. WMMD729]|uniref:VOC family protein n=1 Tax=Micromonospora sp. WMMD729 TaxID=3404127 RepID=UPI003BF57E29
MYPRIHNVSFDCHDTYALSGFWSAVLGADRRHADGTGWVVLADPEGNEFCVLRSAAERTRAASEETPQ